MSAAPVETTERQDEKAAAADDLWHEVCGDCYPLSKPFFVALCGTAKIGTQFTYRPVPHMCVVCIDLSPLPCRECGA